MKKIGIITINDNNNYGNRLQNYAVQEVLKKMNLKVETIYNQKNAVIVRIKEKIKILIPLKKYNRLRCFNKFNKNIKFSNYFIDLNKIVNDKIDKNYDNFFVGSDQVWNPNFDRMSLIDFLQFASKEKRNSFSASFGVSDILEEKKEYAKKYLKEMNQISVREERAKIIVEELTGRNDVNVLVDPTMLLDIEKWENVSQKPKQLKCEKYILNYFLGELSEERKKEINRIAEENNCEIINILDKEGKFYQTGPSEFLYLEKNAFLICTDSFHSSVFAILYNRPFIVFDREDNEAKMNSRINTLINKFDLKNRVFKGKITEDNLNHDYTEAYRILALEREKAELFLKKALELK